MKFKRKAVSQSIDDDSRPQKIALDKNNKGSTSTDSEHLKLNVVSLDVKKPVNSLSLAVDSSPKKLQKKSPPSLSINLKRLGNTRTWSDLISHLHGPDKHKPVLIYGPTGCGKTRGVQDCLRISDINCTLLDGSAPENPGELDTWISQVRDNSVLEGNGGVLFIDDIESFTPMCRDVIMKHIKKTNKSKSPLIITCTDYYTLDLKEFTTLFKNFLTLRMFQPNNETVSKWLQTKGYHINLLEVVVPYSRGDLRACEQTLKFHKQVKSHGGKMTKISASGIDQKQNIFELGNSLLTRKNEKWFEIFSSHGETSHMSHIRLIYENLVQLLYEPTRNNRKDVLVGHTKILDSFSSANWDCLPEFVHAAGMTCQQYIGCKSVSNKWSLPPDKSNIRYHDNKELLRNVRDSYLSRASLKEKKECLYEIYDQIYETSNPNRPCVESQSSDEIDKMFTRINPIRFTKQKSNFWDIPSCLGGINIK